MRAVLDASAFVDASIGAVAYAVAHVEAPTIFDVEVLSAIRRLERRSDIPPTVATAIVELLRQLDVTRHPIPRLTERMWALRHDIATADAAYVSLAEALDIPLMTTDLRLARAAERYCDVIVPT